jgi:hypothetical protein
MPFSIVTEFSLDYDIIGTGAPIFLFEGYHLSSAAWHPLFIARLPARCAVIRIQCGLSSSRPETIGSS